MTLTSTAGAAPASGVLRMTPGRWAALAVGVPVALALIGWTGFSLVGTVARGSYRFSYPVSVQDGQVAANLNVGNVTVRQTPGSTALLTGVVQYGLFRPGISENAIPGGTSVGVNCDGLNSNCNANATLDVPARTAVTVSSDGGDIKVSGFASSVALSAEGGNVTASNLAGSMRLDAGGGDFTGNALDGNLLLVTEGGNINADAVDSQLVTVQSGGGDVTLAFARPPQNLQITADGGNVAVILPQGKTRYDISTPDTQGGNVSYPSALASSTSKNAIMVDSGGGDVSITEG